jgi:hypothetical protein
VNAITGASLDNNTGLIAIPTSSVAGMQSLNFVIGGKVFSMDPAAQLIPQDENTYWGGKTGMRYSVVASMGANSGGGLDFILGQKFMERFYAVFDTDGNRVGFGYT